MQEQTQDVVEETMEDLVDTSDVGQFRMIDVVAAELHALQQDSLRFRKEMDTAKTNVKKNHFRKKLKKSNKKMMNMLVAFEKLRGKEADTSTDAVVIPEPEAPEPVIVPED